MATSRYREILSRGIGKRAILILFQLALTWSAFAQTIRVSGKVLSAQDNEPMIGASILEKGTDNGTISDVDGKYQISVPSGAVLVFSYVGFENIEIKVNGRVEIDALLEPQSTLLQDVVVVGYKKEIKSNVTGAIASLGAREVERLPVLGIDQALQGQVAGLQVTQATGAPGDDIAVRIRGAGTIGNNNPLFIVDGVPTSGNINMFSTSDIASIEVLKDGAAAAIYGARAANGVILITTKRGKAGKPQYSFSSNTGIQQPVNLPELLNAREYVTIRNEAIANANALRDPRRQLTPYDLKILDTLPDVDWMDEVFNLAPMQRYSLSATGGSENGNFYLLGEYVNQQGIFRGQGFEKYVLRFNGETGDRKLKFGNNLSVSFTDRQVIGSSGDGAGPGNQLSGIRYALIAAPVFKIRHPDGRYVNTSLELGDPMLYGDGNANPLAFIDATDWRVRQYRVFGNVYADLQLSPWLHARSSAGMDFTFRNEKLFKERLSQAIYDPSSLTEGRSLDQNLVWTNVLDLNHDLGRADVHRISALIGMEAISQMSDYLGASASNFLRTSPEFRYLNSNLPQELNDLGNGGVVTEWGLLSYFAQAGYSYKSRYVINAAIRRDGSSRFGPENRYGNFPSVSFAWNVSNEPFFQSFAAVSGLKFRASWGLLGNQEIGLYPYASLVETGKRVYSFGNQIATGAQVIETGNRDIRWETTQQTNAGVELSLWKDRLTFTADYYYKKTSDILVRIPLPQSGGAVRAPYSNAGEVENKGFDFSLLLRNSSGPWSYSASFNLATVRNKVLSLAGSGAILGGFGLSDGPITRTEPGYPIGSFFLYKMEGIFQSQAEIDASPFQTVDTRPGDIRFADLNGDRIIDDKDRAHFGSPFPDFTYGVNLFVSWKNVDFSVLGQGVQGNDVYFLYGNFAYETQTRGFNSYRKILDAWRPDNTDTDVPRVSVDDRNGNRRVSTRFLEDGSYFRLRNVTLGFTFKKGIGKLDFLKGLRVFTTVQNAWTYTKYSGLDPEIQANTNDTRGFGVSSDLAVGIDWGTVPAPRIYMAGINWNF
jgi:TonB-linked SusC/RagA family outer membrane protein